MREYDGYEDLDEYETEGEEEYEEEEEGGEEEYEEEEDPKPTKEQLEYLELRQKLKEAIRKKQSKQSGSANAKSQERQRKDNFGSFFGPSQPVIASRVIQESKSLLENQHLVSRVSSSQTVHKKSSGQATAGSQVRQMKAPKAINPLKVKVQKLKDTRDYSFLLSEDAELPDPRKARPDRNVSASKSEARAAQVSQKNRQSLSYGSRQVSDRHEERKPVSSGHEDRRPISNGRDDRRLVSNGRDDRRPVSNGRDDRRPVSNGQDDRRPVSNGQDDRRPVSNGQDDRRPVSNGRDERKPVSNGREEKRPVSSGREERRPTSNGREERRPVSNGREETRAIPMNGKLQSKAMPQKKVSSYKQYGSSNGSGPGRPVGPKSLPSKTQVGTADRRVSAPVAKSSAPSLHKSHPSKSNLPVSKQPLRQKKVLENSNRTKLIQKQMAASSKSQINKSVKQVPRTSMQDQRPKKRPLSHYSDEEDDDDDGRAISMIRQMFRYNPNKYRDDDDDSDMEANFDDILREEKRSARIAREEDERELRLIEEEERRERMRKEAKKRKLSH